MTEDICGLLLKVLWTLTTRIHRLSTVNIAEHILICRFFAVLPCYNDVLGIQIALLLIINCI